MNVKQLQVFCSRDLEHLVLRAFDAVGGKFLPRGDVPSSMTWEAALFILPGVPDEAVEQITRQLREYAGNCEIEPCLRLVVVPVESVV